MVGLSLASASTVGGGDGACVCCDEAASTSPDRKFGTPVQVGVPFTAGEAEAGVGATDVSGLGVGVDVAACGAGVGPLVAGGGGSLVCIWRPSDDGGLAPEPDLSLRFLAGVDWVEPLEPARTTACCLRSASVSIVTPFWRLSLLSSCLPGSFNVSFCGGGSGVLVPPILSLMRGPAGCSSVVGGSGTAFFASARRS
jgi:hypothetical protein